MKDVSIIIRELRKKNCLTQVQFGDILNCDRYRVMDIERGKTKPTIDDLITLKKHFNISTDYLLGLTDIMTSDIDIKTMCEYTGLSESAIAVLHKTRPHNFGLATIDIRDKYTNECLFQGLVTDEHIKQLNYLIEDECFFDFLAQIYNHSLYELKIALKNREIESDPMQKNIPYLQSKYLDFYELTDSRDLSLFKLQQIFTKIANNIAAKYIENNNQYFKSKESNNADN